MLESMHKHMKWIMWIIIGLITVAFLFFGIMPSDSGGRTVATVDGETITIDDWNRAYRNVYESYRDILKDQMNDQIAKGLKAQALEGLIADRLLVKGAERMGLRVTDKELQDSIVNIPVFSRQGKFDNKQYEFYLSRMNLSTSAFEMTQREFLLRRKLERIIAESVGVTDAELARIYIERNPKGRAGEFEKTRSSFRQTIMSERKDEALGAYVQGLRAKSKVVVKQDMLEQ
ncbi:MAG: hypothetical protein A2X56_09840 [Nitrospirae bacterium GWC2_57_13]|jgi:peptidyl-prolyl cis-trans isomerase D|nr:MAG: hypothetical protein A2072_03360 [Nitrospirae bacterium GWC1_57_7]OGW29486.1 MAG: hypothetical protein A2X56_09840 [Nitrospirae bacterium GWC2_57_13]OGW45615.1 MAG: hypothetical protein A2X57_12655 [Nitrospirae bacterium GWD2_57_8]HAS53494.1 hypothetical protein [Nitrospiraceae bacterium]